MTRVASSPGPAENRPAKTPDTADRVVEDLARDHSRFRVWAPRAQRVEIRVDGMVQEMVAADDGWYELPGVRAVPGSRYAFRLDDGDLWLPDPRSLSQPDGVHGESEVVDPRALRRAQMTAPLAQRRDPAALEDAAGDAWSGLDLRGRVLYELHVGTFTPGPDGSGGTLDSAIERLDELVELGVDAVELMPIATFPGDRGWGYDGVGLYAVHAAYGGQEALARFVAAAHSRGLAVVLDVVHNHLGPDGNYLSLFGPYFTDQHETPWGEAVNLDQPGSRQVRDFLLGSARQWLVDVGLDGLRLDAVHELQDDSERHLLAELSDAVARWSQEEGRPLTLIAESDRNDPRTVTATSRGGLGMDMQWADDVHHGVHAWITGERQGYYADFGGADALATVLTRVFLHAGTWSSFRERLWGAPVVPGSPDYDAHSFVTFLQDHDQVGNRAAGDRIHHSISAGRHAAASALILLGPGTPMLFQGEEWAASTPFTYFTDHEPRLGALVTEGRTREFAAMGWSEQVPDPQLRSTFTASILRRQERADGAHARMLEWYRTLLRLRRTEPALRSADLRGTAVDVLDEETVLLRRRAPGGGEVLALVHRGDRSAELPEAESRDAVLLASSQSILDGTPLDRAEMSLRGAGALVLRRP